LDSVIALDLREVFVELDRKHFRVLSRRIGNNLDAMVISPDCSRYLTGTGML
jgi:hypothetical protein